MPVRGPCTLKRTASDTSDALILTFHHQWEQPLKRGAVHVVFRKQGPPGPPPKIIYAYISAPTSAIVCRIAVHKHENVSLNQAIRLADQGSITVEELKKYAGNRASLVVTHIDRPQIARKPIACEFLSKNYNFWPSSTYIPLSGTGVKVLDRLGDFSEKTPGGSHGR